MALVVLLNSQNSFQDIIHVYVSGFFVKITDIWQLLIQPISDHNRLGENLKLGKLISNGQISRRAFLMRVELFLTLAIFALLLVPVVGQEKSASDWNDEGTNLTHSGQYDDAVNAFNEAIDMDPSFAEAWCNKGIALDELGKHDEAIDAYDEAIKINPQLIGAWYNKGITLDEQNNHEGAIEAYDEAIKIDPRFAEAWTNKGVSFAIQGKYDDAINAFDEAIKINPQFAKAWYNKAIALKTQGSDAEADEALTKAKDLGYDAPINSS